MISFLICVISFSQVRFLPFSHHANTSKACIKASVFRSEEPSTKRQRTETEQSQELFSPTPMTLPSVAGSVQDPFTFFAAGAIDSVERKGKEKVLTEKGDEEGNYPIQLYS